MGCLSIAGYEHCDQAGPLGCPLGCPLRVDHEQVREVRESIDSQQVHSLNQDLALALAQEKDQSHALVQSHDQPNGGVQQQGKSSCLQWCWVQVMLHEKEQQQVMVVGKRRLGGAVVIKDERVQVNVEYIMVAVVLPPVEGEEQGQVVE